MIINCIPFFNELDLLEIRLRELADVVHKFVVGEGTLTFSGKPKPLVFAEARERFARWSNQISYVRLDDWDYEYLEVDINDPWKMDPFHKQEYLRVLQSMVEPHDTILITDADEIPSREAVKRFDRGEHGPIANLQMRLYYLWLNARAGVTNNTKAIRAGELNRRGWKYLPVREERECPLIKEAGWHFSYLGDVQEKLAAYAHQEFNKPPHNTPEFIAECRATLGDVLCRGTKMHRADLDELPLCVREQPERWSHLLYEGQ